MDLVAINTTQATINLVSLLNLIYTSIQFGYIGYQYLNLLISLIDQFRLA